MGLEVCGLANNRRSLLLARSRGGGITRLDFLHVQEGVAQQGIDANFNMVKIFKEFDYILPFIEANNLDNAHNFQNPL